MKEKEGKPVKETQRYCRNAKRNACGGGKVVKEEAVSGIGRQE